MAQDVIPAVINPYTSVCDDRGRLSRRKSRHIRLVIRTASVLSQSMGLNVDGRSAAAHTPLYEPLRASQQYDQGRDIQTCSSHQSSRNYEWHLCVGREMSRGDSLRKEVCKHDSKKALPTDRTCHVAKSLYGSHVKTRSVCRSCCCTYAMPFRLPTR